MDRNPLLSRIEAGSFGDSPTHKYTVKLQSKVGVRSPGPVLLNYEAKLVRVAMLPAPTSRGFIQERGFDKMARYFLPAKRTLIGSGSIEKAARCRHRTRQGAFHAQARRC